MRLPTAIACGLVAGVALGALLGPWSPLLRADQVRIAAGTNARTGPGPESEAVPFPKGARVPLIETLPGPPAIHRVAWKPAAAESPRDLFVAADTASLASSTGETIVTIAGRVGGLFLSLLWMVIVPLVSVSVILGMAGLGDLRKLGRIGGKVLLVYLVSAAVAATLAVCAANLVQPGRRVGAAVRDGLVAEFGDQATQRVGTAREGVIKRVGDATPDVWDTLGDLLFTAVPRNPVKALADGEMLPIIVFALLLGAALTRVSAERARPTLAALDGLQAALLQLVEMTMWLAPIGVAALIMSVVGSVGLSVLVALVWYAVTVAGVLVVETVVVYGGAVWWLGGCSPRDFFIAYRPAMLVAFSSASSAASLPVNMAAATRLGVPQPIVAFATSVGTTVNMDGTAIFQACAAIFIAQAFGVDLPLHTQFTIVALATLASIGTAPVPGAGLVMLAMVLEGARLPATGIALILAVDRVLDMLRTVVNVLGDGVAAVIVARWEGSAATGLRPDVVAAE